MVSTEIKPTEKTAFWKMCLFMNLSHEALTRLAEERKRVKDLKQRGQVKGGNGGRQIASSGCTTPSAAFVLLTCIICWRMDLFSQSITLHVINPWHSAKILTPFPKGCPTLLQLLFLWDILKWQTCHNKKYNFFHLSVCNSNFYVLEGLKTH